MKRYLKTLIEEKGREIDDAIEIDGHIGLTWEMLIEFVASMPEHHGAIRRKLVAIDFRNGDVFAYLTHLAKGMLVACGYEVEVAAEPSPAAKSIGEICGRMF